MLSLNLVFRRKLAKAILQKGVCRRMPKQDVGNLVCDIRYLTFVIIRIIDEHERRKPIEANCC